MVRRFVVRWAGTCIAIACSGVPYDFPSAAAAVVRGRSTNGWADWGLVRQDGTITLMKLREELTGPASPPEGNPGPA